MATYTPEINNGFHFRKEQPAESHVMVNGYVSSIDTSVVMQNETAIPNTGDFTATEVHSYSGSTIGRFSDAPNGQMAYCNGLGAYIWGGDEMRVSRFIFIDPDDNNNKWDFTEQVQNTLTDSNNVATVQRGGIGGIDAYAILMLHCDGTDGSTTFTDSSTTPHTVTAQGDAQLDTQYYKFGTAAGLFDGTGDYLTIPDHDDFDFSGGVWSFDCRVRVATGVTTDIGLYGQGTDSSNYLYLYLEKHATLSQWRPKIELVIAGTTHTVTASSYCITETGEAAWYHVEFVQNDDYFYIFVGGMLRKSQGFSPAIAPANYTGQVYIGACGYAAVAPTHLYSGSLDEIRISKGVARHTANYQSPSEAYSTVTISAQLLIGSTRPLDGVKFYIGTANTTAGTMTGFYWDGTEWTALSSLVDGTASGGDPLSVTGFVTFSSTESTAKIKVIDEVVLYWYKFIIPEVDATTTIYHCTLSAPFQSIKDLWDGAYRAELSMFMWDDSEGVYKDFTTNVFEELYTENNAATYAEISTDTVAFTESDHMVVGFLEQIMAIKVNIVPEYENTANDVVMYIQYWDGDSWVEITTWGDGFEDGTAEDGSTLRKSGVLSWTPPARSSEFKRTIEGSLPLYYYKINILANLSLNIRINYMAGIPSQKEMRSWKFPLFAKNKLWLCCNEDKDKNAIMCSMTYAPDVFNGDDSAIFYMGDESAILAACNLYSRLGSSIYSVTLFFKAREIWGLTGNSVNDFVIYEVSNEDGCVAPLTLDTMTVAYEGYAKPIAIWQGIDGIYLFDNSAVIPIHRDIRDRFDRRASTRVDRDKIGDSVGFFDHENKEYHWLYAETGSSTLNKEMVFDVLRGRWYEINRGTGKALLCGWTVMDTSYNTYNYGAIAGGYIERLEYGTTFDGNAIAHEFHTGDIALHKGSSMYETKIRNLKLISVAKTVTSENITMTHYGDTKTASTEYTQSPQNSGYRVTNFVKSHNLGDYIFHSFKATISTDDETYGFEPLAISGFYKLIREDTRS